MSSIMSSRLWSLNAALLHEGILRLLWSFWLHLRNHLTGPLVQTRILSPGNVAPAFTPASNMLLTRVLLTIVASVLSSACTTFEASCICAPLQALASCFLPLCEMVKRSACTQCPAMPQPVDEKYPLTHNTKSSLHTERLYLGKGIGADMSALNPSRPPLKHRPEPCWPTSREIF